MDAMLWVVGALLLSAILSITVALRELRRRNFLLGGLALTCLAACVVALAQPFETHAVIAIPVEAHAD